MIVFNSLRWGRRRHKCSLVILFALAVAVCSYPGIVHVAAFTPIAHSNKVCRRALGSPLPAKRESDDDEDEEDDGIDVSNQDWRAFRAKLVMGEPDKQKATEQAKTAESSVLQDDDDLDGIGAIFSATTSSKTNSTTQRLPVMTPLDPSQWAYDSGNVIEQGAVILGGVEQDFGFGLRQQYFHKAAILVLDHEESTFTKGIILNRPTDIELEDDQGLKWRVWFGGDVQGLEAPNAEFVCLHTLQSDAVKKASVPVMNDIHWTTFDTAKSLVQSGLAKPKDFWLFCGYAGWGPKQLAGELERKSWYMVATDSVTLVQELQSLGKTADPRDAGLDTWLLLMNMIGRHETAEQSMNKFDDLMLKEWAQEHLLDSKKHSGELKKSPSWKGSLDRLMGRGSQASTETPSGSTLSEPPFRVGTLVRASIQAGRSPFLLESQELHKSVLLVLNDDEVMTVAAILNLPGAQPMDMGSGASSSSGSSGPPLRFGGPYTIKGATEPIMWLHCSPSLKQRKVGRPINPNDIESEAGFWKCSSEEVNSAWKAGHCSLDDFLIVTGVSIFTKEARDSVRGMAGEISQGRFEVIDPERSEAVWRELRQQNVLSRETLAKNMLLAHEAWMQGNEEQPRTPNEDDSTVFKTDVKVSKLADDAHKSWVATFLLGNPSLDV